MKLIYVLPYIPVTIISFIKIIELVSKVLKFAIKDLIAKKKKKKDHTNPQILLIFLDVSITKLDSVNFPRCKPYRVFAFPCFGVILI